MRAGDGALRIARASLRLPEVALDALRQIGPMHAELVQMREQTASMPELQPAIERLEGAIGTMDERLAALGSTMDAMADEVASMRRTLDEVRHDLESVPGVDEDDAAEDDRGLVARARDAVTGSAPPG